MANEWIDVGMIVLSDFVQIIEEFQKCHIDYRSYREILWWMYRSQNKTWSLFQGGGEFLLCGSLSFSGWGLYFIIPITRSSIFFFFDRKLWSGKPTLSRIRNWRKDYKLLGRNLLREALKRTTLCKVNGEVRDQHLHGKQKFDDYSQSTNPWTVAGTNNIKKHVYQISEELML
jgi:hypothetical protein